MSITFSVIDTSCQAADSSFFPVQVKLVTAATTKFINWYGYSEFIPSTPPKKYHTITFSGFSERVGFTAEQTPRQCAGAKYAYGGAGNVDAAGNQITKYNKNFYAQCAKQFWPLEPLQTLPGAITTGGAFPTLVGYCWPTDPASCPTCDSDDTTWPLIGNYATNNPLADLSAFMRLPGDAVVTATSWSINSAFHGITSIERNAPYTFLVSSGTYQVVVGSVIYDAVAVVTNPLVVTFPVVSINGIADQYVVFTDTNNYSASLSNEYTDAEALANAKVVTSAGATAQNLPRTTGFTTVTTDVAYVLSLSNLVVGNAYNVTVDLWDQVPATGASVHTPKSYGFTATATTHTINDTIATPAAGHITTVRSPTISLIP